MHAAQIASLGNASVQQLRNAIRRVTATQLAPDGRNEERFLAGVVVSDSTWGEWEDKAVDLRQLSS